MPSKLYGAFSADHLPIIYGAPSCKALQDAVKLEETDYVAECCPVHVDRPVNRCDKCDKAPKFTTAVIQNEAVASDTCHQLVKLGRNFTVYKTEAGWTFKVEE